jgi:hypothetical protein
MPSFLQPLITVESIPWLNWHKIHPIEITTFLEW